MNFFVIQLIYSFEGLGNHIMLLLWWSPVCICNRWWFSMCINFDFPRMVDSSKNKERSYTFFYLHNCAYFRVAYGYFPSIQRFNSIKLTLEIIVRKICTNLHLDYWFYNTHWSYRSYSYHIVFTRIKIPVDYRSC